jgi:hypothetical protein
MKESDHRMRHGVLWLVSLAFVVCLGLAFWGRSGLRSGDLEVLRNESTQLREQLEARDKTIAELRAILARMEGQPAAASEELRQRVVDLARSQSNTLALV